ncbi:MAG TPA: bifunctional riboflavin kinase/FAD synthetase [Kofleriaceae bacterium]|nr:bifunctional riboflavin kinase/FAD synthetase [Kofleriaceae bacterium]
MIVFSAAMQVYRGHEHAPAWREGTAVAIGNFDGVHLGHRALISRARSLADAHGAQVVALTFDPHPSTLFSASPPPMISSLARRIELLGEAGADAVVVEPFTRALASKAPYAFIDDIVINALSARAIVVGYDFSYGQGRTGTTDALQAHGGRAVVEVAIVSAVAVDGEVASSTRIRQHLKAGELAAAERLLGRRWDVDGIVVHGAKRGRAIGVPTANIKAESDLPLRPGIYAVMLSVEGGTHRPAVASLGTNPTFVEHGGGLVLEVHVLDFDEDIYGKRTRTTFVQHLRDEAKFDSVEALVEQIRADIDAARRVL